MSTVTCERNLPQKVEEKQGIVSILGSDSPATKPPAASLRRTLSADMSSKKWLAENGFNKHPVMKRNSSSAQLSFISATDHQSSSSEEEEEFYGKKVKQSPKQDDVWSSIVSQKKTEELSPPYVHPLVKKSSSSLCSKSLEICTESLGSETGSDKVTLCQPIETESDVNGSAKVEELQPPLAQQEEEKSQGSLSEKTPAVAKYNNSTAKKMQSKSFPPPIPLLAGSSDGPSLHMHSHRVNGRLVLEAVSVPSTKKLQAHRQDGRLRLAFIQPPTGKQHVQQPDRDKATIFDRKGYKTEDGIEDVFDIFDQEEDENDIYKDDDETIEEIEEELNDFQEYVMEQAVPEKVSGVINIHRSALMMKKIMGLENQNPKGSHKFTDAAAKAEPKYEDREKTTLPQSLPPRPRTTRSISTTPAAAAASYNTYEYFWRPKPATSLKSPLTHCSTAKNDTDNKIPTPHKPKSYEQQELLALRNCRKARRSLLSWDAYCIATT